MATALQVRARQLKAQRYIDTLRDGLARLGLDLVDHATSIAREMERWGVHDWETLRVAAGALPSRRNGRVIPISPETRDAVLSELYRLGRLARRAG